MAVMMAKITKCPFPYLPVPYGCWCGPTIPWPQTEDPIDKVDALCKTHDYCYEDAEINLGCDILDEYILPYKWTFYENKVQVNN